MLIGPALWGWTDIFCHIASLHLVLNKFLFPPVQQNLLAIFELIREAPQNHMSTFPILLCPLSCANTTGAVFFTSLTGEAHE
jgi:hypothetical protein